MGLFAHRPEEPTEWAGLPSEPARIESAAERLVDAVPASDALGAFEGGAVESIVIPVTPPPAATQAVDSGQGGPDPDEHGRD